VLDMRDAPFMSALIAEHDRNVSLISLAIGIGLVLGVRYSGRLPVISESLLLGGILTIMYSVGFSCHHSPKIAAIPVGAGLAVALVLAHDKFVKAAKS